MAASKNLTPEQRVERARNAGRAAHSLDALIRKIADRASELSEDQRNKLQALLDVDRPDFRPSEGPTVKDGTSVSGLPAGLHEQAMAAYDQEGRHSNGILAVVQLTWAAAQAAAMDVDRPDFRPSDGPHQHRASCDDAGGNHMCGHQ